MEGKLRHFSSHFLTKPSLMLVLLGSWDWLECMPAFPVKRPSLSNWNPTTQSLWVLPILLFTFDYFVFSFKTTSMVKITPMVNHYLLPRIWCLKIQWWKLPVFDLISKILYYWNCIENLGQRNKFQNLFPYQVETREVSTFSC